VIIHTTAPNPPKWAFGQSFAFVNPKAPGLEPTKKAVQEKQPGEFQRWGRNHKNSASGCSGNSIWQPKGLQSDSPARQALHHESNGPNQQRDEDLSAVTIAH
jgi:hypothetical protein